MDAHAVVMCLQVLCMGNHLLVWEYVPEYALERRLHPDTNTEAVRREAYHMIEPRNIKLPIIVIPSHLVIVPIPPPVSTI